jgi:hypothetical protein
MKSAILSTGFSGLKRASSGFCVAIQYKKIERFHIVDELYSRNRISSLPVIRP